MPQSEEAIKQLWAKLVAQSWEDDNLRRRLLEEPAAVLKENGVEVPAGATVKTFEDDDDGDTIVLPVARQPAEKELSDQELETVAGGYFGSYTFRSIGNWSFGKLSLKNAVLHEDEIPRTGV